MQQYLLLTLPALALASPVAWFPDLFKWKTDYTSDFPSFGAHRTAVAGTGGAPPPWATATGDGPPAGYPHPTSFGGETPAWAAGTGGTPSAWQGHTRPTGFGGEGPAWHGPPTNLPEPVSSRRPEWYTQHPTGPAPSEAPVSASSELSSVATSTVSEAPEQATSFTLPTAPPSGVPSAWFSHATISSIPASAVTEHPEWFTHSHPTGFATGGIPESAISERPEWFTRPGATGMPGFFSEHPEWFSRPTGIPSGMPSWALSEHPTWTTSVSSSAVAEVSSASIT